MERHRTYSITSWNRDRNSFRESNVTHLTNLALSRVDVMVRTGLKVVQRVGEGGARRKREITNP